MRIAGAGVLVLCLLMIASSGCVGEGDRENSLDDGVEIPLTVRDVADCPFAIDGARLSLTTGGAVCSAVVESRTRLTIQRIALQCSVADTAQPEGASALPVIELTWEGSIASGGRVEIRASAEGLRPLVRQRADMLRGVLEPRSARYSDGSEWVAGGPVGLSE